MIDKLPQRKSTIEGLNTSLVGGKSIEGVVFPREHRNNSDLEDGEITDSDDFEEKLHSQSGQNEIQAEIRSKTEVEENMEVIVIEDDHCVMIHADDDHGQIP